LIGWQTCGQSGREKIPLEAILSVKLSRCYCKLSGVEGLHIFNPLLRHILLDYVLEALIASAKAVHDLGRSMFPHRVTGI
jgi:hypothetical protein